MTLHALKPPPESPDELHEQRIRECWERYVRHEADWPEVVELLRQRSPEMVEKMEREKGLL
jgi:hypothetical protein